MGGYPSIRHNEIRDLTAELLSEVCHSVSIEPHLQPLGGETLRGASANIQDGARLDIAANGFWGRRFERAFFDVRVFNTHAPTNRQPQLSSCYRRHENAKKRVYDQRIREVEHSSFVPLVMSVTGGLGRIAIYNNIQASGIHVILQMESTIFHHHGIASMSSVIFSSSCIRSRYQGGSLFFRTFRQIFRPCRPCDC